MRTSRRGTRSASVGAFVSNALKSVNPWFGSTGLRSPELRHAALGDPTDGRVAETFIVNSRYSRHSREADVSGRNYFDEEVAVMLAQMGRRDASGLPVIPLPKGQRLHMGIGEALQKRRSVRSYSGEAMPLSALSSLARAAIGVTGEGTSPVGEGGACAIPLRTAPSGGGLQAIELHIAALNVEGLRRGIYQFDNRENVLVGYRGADSVQPLVSAFVLPEGYIALDAAACLMLLVARPWRSMRKYGPRGLRYTLMEAGYVAQNVHLAGAALGVGSVDFQGFCDNEANSILGFDGIFEFLTHIIVVGQA